MPRSGHGSPSEAHKRWETGRVRLLGAFPTRALGHDRTVMLHFDGTSSYRPASIAQH